MGPTSFSVFDGMAQAATGVSAALDGSPVGSLRAGFLEAALNELVLADELLGDQATESAARHLLLAADLLRDVLLADRWGAQVVTADPTLDALVMTVLVADAVGQLL